MRRALPKWRTSQSDWHCAAGDTLSSVSGEATSVFTHSGGIQAFAANGPLSVQAHTDALEVLADKAVTVISVNDAIAINAKQKIVLQAGESSVTLDGSNITFACSGTFAVKGAAHSFAGGGSQAAQIKSLPDSKLAPPPERQHYSQQFDLSELIASGSHSGLHSALGTIEITKPDGTHITTVGVNELGLSDRIFTEESESIVAWIGEGSWEITEEYELIADDDEGEE